MAGIPDDIALAHHRTDSVPAILDQICTVYADAYGHVPSEDTATKVGAFRNRAARALARPGYELVTAHADGFLAGFAFGYSLPSDTQWWDDLTPEPAPEFVRENGSRTFVLAEIEVGRRWQGSGIGRALHDELLGSRHEERATLATGPGADTARAIYERWGWQRIGVVPGTAADYFSEYTLYVLALPIVPTR